MPGARLHGYSLFRTVGNYGLNSLCGLMVRRWIADQGSGLNMYRMSYLASRFYLPFDNGLIFPNTLFFYGVETNSSYRFFPISWRAGSVLSAITRPSAATTCTITTPAACS